MAMILIVEDEKLLRWALEKRLQKLGRRPPPSTGLELLEFSRADPASPLGARLEEGRELCLALRVERAPPAARESAQLLEKPCELFEHGLELLERAGRRHAEGGSHLVQQLSLPLEG